MRLIDANETKHNLAISDEVRFKYLSDFGKVCNFIDEQPTIDAVAVVRCGECKHRTELAPTGWHPCVDMAVSDDWFCADGEREVQG